MTSKRKMRTGPQRPVRIFSFFGGAATAITLATASLVLPSPANAQTAVVAAGAQGIFDFYAARQGRPIWFSQNGRQVDALLEILNSAEIDGLRPERYRVDLLTRAVWAAQSGKPKAVRRADLMLSQALVAYVRDLRQPGNVGVIYVDPELKPGPPSPRAILEAASSAPSLELTRTTTATSTAMSRTASITRAPLRAMTRRFVASRAALLAVRRLAQLPARSFRASAFWRAP